MNTISIIMLYKLMKIECERTKTDRAINTIQSKDHFNCIKFTGM